MELLFVFPNELCAGIEQPSQPSYLASIDATSRLKWGVLAPLASARADFLCIAASRLPRIGLPPVID